MAKGGSKGGGVSLTRKGLAVGGATVGLLGAAVGIGVKEVVPPAYHDVVQGIKGFNSNSQVATTIDDSYTTPIAEHAISQTYGLPTPPAVQGALTQLEGASDNMPTDASQAVQLAEQTAKDAHRVLKADGLPTGPLTTCVDSLPSHIAPATFLSDCSGSKIDSPQNTQGRG